MGGGEEGGTYHDNYLRVWPCFMHAGHELDVAVIEGRAGNVIYGSVVVGTQVNDDEICRSMGTEIPLLGLVSVGGIRTHTCIGGVEPLVCLSKLDACVCAI